MDTSRRSLRARGSLSCSPFISFYFFPKKKPNKPHTRTSFPLFSLLRHSKPKWFLTLLNRNSTGPELLAVQALHAHERALARRDECMKNTNGINKLNESFFSYRSLPGGSSFQFSSFAHPLILHLFDLALLHKRKFPLYGRRYALRQRHWTRKLQRHDPVLDPEHLH